VLLLVALTWARTGLPQGLPLDSRQQGKKVMAALYEGAELQPVAVFRAERIFGDYQRRGFFRIGALPLLVLDGLSIELHDPARLPNALTTLSERFNALRSAKKAVEGRDFRLSFAAEKAGGLRASRVRLESATAWHLQEGTIQPAGGALIRFRQGTLTIAGPQAGQFTGETANGTVRMNLLSLLSNTRH
jgi:hypothetical protein